MVCILPAFYWRRLFFRIRQFPFISLVSKADRKSFWQNGYILKEDFLPQNLFDELLVEVKAYNGSARQCVQGDTITWRVFFDKNSLKGQPIISKLATYKPFRRLLSYGSARVERPMMYIQQIRNSFEKGNSDPQKNFHSDTFHPTMKAWLFLEDVVPEKGPFTYVAGSHKPTLKRLKWDYEKSLTAAKANDGYTEKGSFRITGQELAELGFDQIKPMLVKKNSFVMGNTYGFHRRGDSAPNATRLEIYCSSRVSPFSILPGCGLMADIRDAVLNKYYAKKDAEATKKGSRATWHKADGSVI